MISKRALRIAGLLIAAALSLTACGKDCGTVVVTVPTAPTATAAPTTVDAPDTSEAPSEDSTTEAADPSLTGMDLLNAVCDWEQKGSVAVKLQHPGSDETSGVCADPKPDGSDPIVILRGHPQLLHGRSVCPKGQTLFNRDNAGHGCAVVTPEWARVIAIRISEYCDANGLGDQAYNPTSGLDGWTCNGAT